MLGLTGDGRLRVRAMPTERMKKDHARRAFLRVRAWEEHGDLLAAPAGGQASSQLRPMADANALLVVPEGADAAEPALTYEAIVLEPLPLAHS
jgi:molybdopterin biosynthesis enzyme